MLSQLASDLINNGQRILRLIAKYPSLRRQTDRWNREYFCTKEVNALVTDCEFGHSRGCCDDSPMRVRPYLETPDGRIYSDPVEFSPGELNGYWWDEPYDNWEQKFLQHGISQAVIDKVAAYFEKEKKEAEESNDGE